jgi:hypothetical protein
MRNTAGIIQTPTATKTLTLTISRSNSLTSDLMSSPDDRLRRRVTNPANPAALAQNRNKQTNKNQEHNGIKQPKQLSAYPLPGGGAAAMDRLSILAL